MKSVQCSSPPWAGVALFPGVTPYSSQLVLWVWLDHWGLQQAMGVGRREDKRVYLYWAVHVGKPALWKWWMSPVSLAWVTLQRYSWRELLHGWLWHPGTGNFCVILTVSLPFPKLPWGDVPEWVTAPPDCLSERFPELAEMGFEGSLVMLQPLHL